MKLRVLGFSLIVFFATSLATHAAQFVYQYTDTISATSVDGLSNGDNAVITLTLDNGGTSNQNQTWTSFDLAIVDFNFGDGAVQTTFFSPFDGGLASGLGSFTTDAAGNLLTVMTSWFDEFVTADYTTNISDSDNYLWYLNGINGVFFFDNLSADVSDGLNLSNVEDILDPNAWTEVTNPVPVPAAVWLFGSALVGLVSLRRRQQIA